ncbi:hypothetical protein PSTT_08376 [Puccinia striiformis]|uniref:Uncharacterized protein n=2 Tax=Puccinia striiformis TaxID=27350 RepID=A0A2S4VCT2_9BASI|nr:hypothetical protein PSTT_08376 [Puccinia striiformis]
MSRDKAINLPDEQCQETRLAAARLGLGSKLGEEREEAGTGTADDRLYTIVCNSNTPPKSSSMSFGMKLPSLLDHHSKVYAQAAGSSSKLDSTSVGGSSTRVIDPTSEFRPLEHATTDSCNSTKSQAEALISDSSLAEQAVQLSPCDVRVIPLIAERLAPIASASASQLSDRQLIIQHLVPLFVVKLNLAPETSHVVNGIPTRIWVSLTAPGTTCLVNGKPNVEEDIVRFWKNLPEATLVGEGEGQYLELKDSHVLGNRELGQRFLVRPIYKELCDLFERNSSVKHKWVVTGTPGIEKTFFSAYYLWIAACEKQTVVWQPFQSPQNPTSTYLMTSGGVEWLANTCQEFLDAHANPETIYIVDGRTPLESEAWTLLVTPPLKEHYK